MKNREIQKHKTTKESKNKTRLKIIPNNKLNKVMLSLTGDKLISYQPKLKTLNSQIAGKLPILQVFHLKHYKKNTD